MALVALTLGFQPEIVPSSVANMKILGPDFPFALTTESPTMGIAGSVDRWCPKYSTYHKRDKNNREEQNTSLQASKETHTRASLSKTLIHSQAETIVPARDSRICLTAHEHGHATV